MKEVFLPPTVTNRSEFPTLHLDLVVLEKVCQEFEIPVDAVANSWIAFRNFITIYPECRTFGLYFASGNRIKVAVLEIAKDCTFSFSKRNIIAPNYSKFRSSKLHQYLLYTNSRPELWARRDKFLRRMVNRTIEREISRTLFHEFIHLRQIATSQYKKFQDSLLYNLFYDLQLTFPKIELIESILHELDPYEQEADLLTSTFLHHYPQFHELVKINLLK